MWSIFPCTCWLFVCLFRKMSIQFLCQFFQLSGLFAFVIELYEFLIIFVFKLLFISVYFWLHWVFIAMRRLSLVAVSRGYSSLQCMGFSLQSMGSRVSGLQQLQHTGLGVVAPGPSGSMAYGIFLDQGSNPCPLHWQMDSKPLDHQGSPALYMLDINTLSDT